MSDIYSALAEMGISLTNLAVKGTVTAINAKIKSIKDEKSAERIRNTYDEIINELLSEREEAIRIAQMYKAELDRMVISDKELEQLHNTVLRVFEMFKAFQGPAAIANGNSELQKSTTEEQIKELLSIDTLKTIQLLGFNYKAAIGEPLTQIWCKSDFFTS